MDSRITNIISTIHFSLISLIIFITLLSTSLFIVLQNGIVLKEVNFSNLHIKELHVSVKDGLNIYAQSISVTNSNSQKENMNFSTKELGEILSTLEDCLPFLHSINIKKLRINKNILSINYKINNPLHVSMNNEDIALKLSAILTKKYLNIYLHKFKTLDKFLHVSGFGSFDRVTKNAYFKLKSTLVNQDKQISYLFCDDKGIAFNTIFLTPLSKLKEIVDYAQLHKKTKPWIIQKAKANAPEIEHLSGYIPFNNPSEILRTLKAKGHWSNVAYTFQKGFEPAKADRVDIYFEKGILTIMPRDAKFYSHDVRNPTITIDFNPKEFQLKFHLHTTARLDKVLVALIRSYKITLPFMQKKGLLKADLKLFINLDTIATGALGNFEISESIVTFEGVDYKVHSGIVKIKDNDVSLIDLNVSYKTLTNAIINGAINAQEMKGKLNIDISKINFLQKPKVFLDQKPLHVSYTLIPHQLDSIAIDKSLWSAFDKSLHVGAIQARFNYKTLQMRLPATSLYIDDALQMELEGNIDIKNELYEFNSSVSQFNLFDFKLQKKPLHVSLNYDKNLSIVSDENSSWLYTTLPIAINGIDASLNKEKLKINTSRFIINKDIQSNISGLLSLSNLNGSFQLKNISVSNDKIGKILSFKDSLPLQLSIKEKKFDVKIPKLNFSLLALKEGWRLNIADISQITPYSALMQEYNISKGSLYIGENSGKKGLYFTGNIDYAYPFLIQNEKPQYNYKFHGSVDKNNISILLNEDINIKIDNDVNVTCKNIGLNLSAFIDFLKEHNSSESNTSTPFSFNADNSYIYFSPKRKAVSDNIKISAKGNEIFASLIYKKGGAGLEMHKSNFYLYGQHFDDTFMNSFFSLSEHKGGSFSFALKGNLETFKGVARIDKGRIMDYVLFNNILAFINTIPSLTSFSLPSYAKEGIEVKEAYAAFEYREKLMHFNAVKFDSGEIGIYGQGSADYFNNKIDIALNLKTHLGKNISKLPVVGYILVGDDGTAATAFNITGKLTDPHVETALVKNIIIAPFNILKRTIVYPFHLIKNLIDEKNITKELDPTHFLEQ